MPRRRVLNGLIDNTFFIAGRLTRQILVDELRRKKAKKRHGLQHTFTEFSQGEKPIFLEDLDVALYELEARSPELARMVDLHFFVGMGFGEIAAVFEITEAQVRHRWNKAKMWLRHFLNGH